MEKLIAASIAGLLVLSASAAWSQSQTADVAPRHDDRTLCPALHARDSSEVETYAGRRRDYCEVRWRRLVAASATRGETYDRFMDRCERKCAAALSPTIIVGGGLLAGGTAGGLIAASGGEDRPASP